MMKNADNVSPYFPGPELAGLAVLAREFRKVEKLAIEMRVLVDGYACEILRDVDLRDRDRGTRITENKWAWLAEEAAYMAYWRRLDAVVRDRIPGASALPDGQCPALLAEEDARQSAWQVMDHAGRLFGFDGRKTSPLLKNSIDNDFFVKLLNYVEKHL